ncbi:membrane protein of unknown function [Denitratisoma oestradiolicum]|uniref:Uncharacterized protein n=2 Tax=Denitratisoma oestradiolicum TaxID=311182 RepID=A0A6S6XR23_9PROT|nr:membrane protein of unknown function [Denitratisoma oestradiolicum]
MGFSDLPCNSSAVWAPWVLAVAGFAGVVALYQKLAGTALDGFTTVIILLALASGALMLGLGIVGLPGPHPRTTPGPPLPAAPTRGSPAMNAWAFALLAVVLNVGAQLALKLADGRLLSLPLVVALACYGASFFLTLKIYAVNPLSLAAPLMAGLTFLLTPLAAVLILNESLGLARVGGIV